MEWEILERKDHPGGCLRAVPQTPKVTEGAHTPNQTVPVVLASSAVPKGGDMSPTWFPGFPAIDPGQVSPLKLVGESLREEFLSPGHKRKGFPVLKMPCNFKNPQCDSPHAHSKEELLPTGRAFPGLQHK